MTEENRFAAPKAVVADLSQVAADPVQRAHASLNQSRLGLVVFFVGFVSLGFLPSHWSPVLLPVMFAGLVLAHVFLGMAASRSGRSWVLYGLAPVLVPLLGALVSFGILRSKIPYTDA